MAVWLWFAFVGFILAMLALDAAMFYGRTRVVGIREALAWTAFWIALPIAFAVCVHYVYEHHTLGIGLKPGRQLAPDEAVRQFLTAYLVEKSISLDNILVIALIFSYFQVPLAFQHRVLFWGTSGAMALRGLMIAGATIWLRRTVWAEYVFGAILLVTAIRLLVVRHDNLHPEKSPLIKLVRTWFPVSEELHDGRFVAHMDGRRGLTALSLVLLLVASTDVLFAVDSIPAAFAVTGEPFLIFTSNAFALLGLRTLYFALAGTMHRFRYLKVCLSLVLAYVGMKMLLVGYVTIGSATSLGIVGGILGLGLLTCLFEARADVAPLVSPLGDELETLAIVTWKQGKRIVILTLGSSILLAGIAMIVLPGPALVVIPMGLALLGTEFVWARRLLKRLKSEAYALAGAVTGGAGTNDPKDATGKTE